MKIGVLLAGCGVYDGSEIHEATFTLLAIDELGHEAVCFAPDKSQMHVVNHITGEEMEEQRNVLIESARIARGSIRSLADTKPADYDVLVIPGGFGAAKNLNRWAVSGPKGEIDPEVKKLITDTVEASKPVAALCMGPTVVAKALEGTAIQPTLTVGTTAEKSPYEIAEISQGMESIGTRIEMKSVREIAVDETNKIVSAPCYMMEARISEVRENARAAVERAIALAK